MLIRYFFILPAYLFIACVPLHGLQVGSPSNLTVEGAAFFSGSDNSIETLALVDGGIAFADASSTGSFNSIFSVEGPLDLNGGFFFLQKELLFINLRGVCLGGGGCWGKQKILFSFFENIVFFRGNLFFCC